MSWELEPWSPPAEPDNNELATVDTEPDVIDTPFTWLQTEPDYDLEPTPEPDNRRGSWGGGWMQQSEPDNAPVAYAEPDVIDTPFTWLQPEPDNAPVKRDSWGGGWFGSNSSELDAIETDSSDLERYTAAYLESDNETLEASWHPLQQPTQAALPADTDAIPAPDFWAQTTALTSQATDVWQDVANDSNTQTKAHSTSKTRAKARNKARQSTAIDTYSPPDGGVPYETPVSYNEPIPAPANPASDGTGGARDYAWYYLAYRDPRESEDIQLLRYWYFLYEFGDMNQEWNEANFHTWAASLSATDLELYTNAGRELADGRLYEHLDAPMKRNFERMRLRGDDGKGAQQDPISYFVGSFFRGFSR